MKIVLLLLAAAGLWFAGVLYGAWSTQNMMNGGDCSSSVAVETGRARA